MTRLISLAAWALLLQAGAASPATDLASRLAKAARGADPAVIRLALAARACAMEAKEIGSGERLTLIDYSKPSTEKRLWVFDLETAQVLYAEHVAHGRSTGENMARHFSNANGSHQTSLGLFRTAETYQGGNGYSLRMDGLEPGINDKARPRQIVMHGAPYVNPEMALRQGRLGRSYGCPAVRPAVAKPLIDSIKDGQLLFAYYPDADWLAQSRFLKCETGRSGLAALHGGGDRGGAAP
jgi:hypothetical protein